MKRLQPLICWLLVILLGNAQWAALQGIAWTTMAINYSSKVGVTEGLRETFDGKHPCAMCCAIKAAKAQETEKEHNLSAPTRDSLQVMTVATECGRVTLNRPPLLGVGSTDTATLRGRSDQPPVPPPP